VPTARGIVVAVAVGALALAGWAWGVEEFALVALAASAVFLCSAALVLVETRRVRRRLLVLAGPSREVTVGTSAVLTLQVVWMGSGPLRSALTLQAGTRWTVSYPGLAGLVGDDPRRTDAALPPTGGRFRPGGDMVAVPGLDAGAPWQVDLPVPTERRGLWTMAPARLWALDPFGLFTRRVAEGPAVHVLVCPDPSRAEAATLPLLPRAGVTAGGTGERHHRSGGGDEFVGLRAYVPGDRLHRLHWPALARNDELVMRDFVELQDHRVLLSLDLRSRRDERLEQAVTAA